MANQTDRALADVVNREQARATTALIRAWSRVGVSDNFKQSWAGQKSALIAALEPIQLRAATAGALVGPAQLAEQGITRPADALISPAAFVGQNGDSRTLDQALDDLPIRAKTAIKAGAEPALALREARTLGVSMMLTMVADVARMATSLGSTVRTRTVWVRVVSPTCCSRCAILAGKTFRWNEGFLRHPRCRCHHKLTTVEAARDIAGPYDHFEGLTAAQQDKLYGAANAKAIRDGADIYQVVNARRGMTMTGMFTSEGTTRRGYWRSTAGGSNLRRRRMTPQAIYDLAGSREEAVSMLADFGYVTPLGQVSGGAIRGSGFGLGQMGRGGARKAASAAVEAWDATGVRDPSSAYTMTAAERRVADAQWRLSEVRAGRNPFSSQATERRFVNAPRISGGVETPLTPEIAARVEQDAVLWTAAQGDAVTYRELKSKAGRGLLVDPTH